MFVRNDMLKLVVQCQLECCRRCSRRTSLNTRGPSCKRCISLARSSRIDDAFSRDLLRILRPCPSLPMHRSDSTFQPPMFRQRGPTTGDLTPRSNHRCVFQCDPGAPLRGQTASGESFSRCLRLRGAALDGTASEEPLSTSQPSGTVIYGRSSGG